MGNQLLVSNPGQQNGGREFRNSLVPPLPALFSFTACGVPAHEASGLAICPANVHADSCRTGSYPALRAGGPLRFDV